MRDGRNHIYVYDQLSGACFVGTWEENSVQDWVGILREGLEL
jgi:hypothetical protein